MEKIDQYVIEMKDSVKEKGIDHYLDWFNRQLTLNKDDLDLRFFYLDFLHTTNRDQQYEKEVTTFLKIAMEIIKDKGNKNLIQRAKAYAYMAFLKRYASDRILLCEKSIEVLSKIKIETNERKELLEFCEEIKREGNRKVFFYLNDEGFIIAK